MTDPRPAEARVRSRSLLRTPAAILLIAALALAACGSDDNGSDKKEAPAKSDKGETTVRDRAFDTEIPGSWRIKDRPATRSAVIGTWRRSVDPESTLVIAVTGKSRQTAEQSLEQLRASVSQRPDFEELAFDRTTVGKQINATRFAFKIGNDQKVFFLFDACGNKTVSLVGTAPSQKFGQVEKSFEETANAFDPNCDGALEPPPDPESVDRALETLATSPSGDFDEVADQLGVNDPAQEAPENEIESTEPDAAAAEEGEEDPGAEEEGLDEEGAPEEGLDEEGAPEEEVPEEEVPEEPDGAGSAEPDQP